MVVTWLIDESARVRLGETPDAPAWAERIAEGRVGIGAVTGQPVERLALP